MNTSYDIHAVQQQIQDAQKKTAETEKQFKRPIPGIPDCDSLPMIRICTTRAAENVRRVGRGRFTRDESIAAAQQFMLTSFKIELHNVTKDKKLNKDEDRTRLFCAAAKRIGLSKPQIEITDRIMRLREQKGLV